MTLQLTESRESLETEADKIRNHLTPIMTYSQLILDGKMGQVSEMHRNKIQVIITEAEIINDLLKTFNKENVPKSSSIKNEIAELELKLVLSKQELKDVVQQIQQLKKEEKKQFRNDVDAISSQIITVQNKVNKNTRLLFFTVILSMITVSGYFIFDMDFEKGSTDGITLIKSKYVTENLRGDTIDTWKFWNIVPGSALTVNIVNSNLLDDDKILSIKETITSLETKLIDDSIFHKGPKGTSSTYYLGWAGSLKDAAKLYPTEYPIPNNFDIIESKRGEGDIVILLSKVKDTDGYAGFTKSIVDGNEILKIYITIYDVNNLSDNQLSAIMRHEMGHAFGLAHSTAPEDLMAPDITTSIPYISECDVSAIAALYNGEIQGQVVCEK